MEHTTRATAPLLKVVVVGEGYSLDTLQASLDPGRYSLTFLESCEYAFSHIKRLRPDLVVVCMRCEEPMGFQLLSMLRIDQDTVAIPLLIFADEVDENDAESADWQSAYLTLGPPPTQSGRLN